MKYIIELMVIDEGNDWNFPLNTVVYWNENRPFVRDALDATMFKSYDMIQQMLEKIIDDGNFMPVVKTVIAQVV